MYQALSTLPRGSQAHNAPPLAVAAREVVLVLNQKHPKHPLWVFLICYCEPTWIRTTVAGFGDQNSTTEL